MTGALTSNAALKNHWYAVARADDVAEAPIGAEVLGVKLAIWRAGDGRLAAFPDRCAHREAPLSKGEIDDGCLVCSYHGWTLRAGRALRARPVGERGRARAAPGPPRPRTAARSATGWCGCASASPAGDIPAMRWEDDPAFRRINPPVEVWQHVDAEDDGQLPRHHPLPVRPPRNVRQPAGPAGAQVRARVARRRVLRLPLRGSGRQHVRRRRRHRSRTPRWCTAR